MRQWVGGLGVAARRPEVQVRLVVRPPQRGRLPSAGLGSRPRLAHDGRIGVLGATSDRAGHDR